MFISKSDKVPSVVSVGARETIVVKINKPDLANGMSGNVTFYRYSMADERPNTKGWKTADGFVAYTDAIVIAVGANVGSSKLMGNYIFGTIAEYSGFIPNIADFKVLPGKDRGIVLLRQRPTATEYCAHVPNTGALKLIPSMDHDIKNSNDRNKRLFEYKDALFALDASKGTTDLVADRVASIFGSGEVLQNGEFCFDRVRGLRYTLETGTPLDALKDFTFEMDYTITSDPGSGYWGYYGNKGSWSNMCVCAQWRRDGYRPSMFWNPYYDTTTGGDAHPEYVNDGIYHHLAWVRKGDVTTLYNDGIATVSRSGITADLNLTIQNQFCVGWQDVEDACLPGRMKHFKITPEALYTSNFENDLPKWVGI